MHLKGETLINSSAETLWAALRDPAALTRFIDDIESLVQQQPDQFAGVGIARIGGVEARFPLRLQLCELEPHRRLRISVQGEGDFAQSLTGSADLLLIAQGPDRTLLQHALTLEPGGPLALVAGPALDAAASRRAENFFSALKAEYALPEAPAAAASAPLASAADIRAASVAAAVGEVMSPARGLPAWAWVGGLVLLVLATTAFLLA